MKIILRKLRSRSGASMIMAMVFMLFCAFVGGSVLASATANAYRVAHLEEQQAFLMERSAALLLSDELQLENGEQFRLSVADSVRSIQEVTVGNGGVVRPTETPPRKERVISFQLTTNDADVTEMQRLMLETTVWRYLLENAAGEAYTLELVNFPGGVTRPDQFYFVRDIPTGEVTDYTIEGSMQVTGTASAVSLPAYTANFSSGRENNIYDFYVDFGELSQLKLTMNAYSGTSNPIEVKSPASEDSTSSTGYVQITTQVTQTTISWDDPMIEKGGAAS